MLNLFSPILDMVCKVEMFKYEKLGTKGVPFRYLEFSRAFGKTMLTDAPESLRAFLKSFILP